MKKIALCIPSLNVGGAEKMVITLAKKLSKEYIVTIFVLSTNPNNFFVDELKQNKIKIIFFDISGRFNLKKFLKVFYKIKKFNPDILHNNLDTLYFPLYSLIMKKKMVFTIHSSPDRLKNLKFFLFIKPLIRNKLIQFVAVSRSIKLIAMKELNIEEKLISIIYNPVDINNESDKKVSFDIQKGNVIFINVARFDLIKNHDNLINAFYKLNREFNDTKLFLLGDGPEREKIEKKVLELGLNSSVEFIGSTQNVENYLYDAHVFVLSSDSEALPITIIEAMTVGLPIISTNVGGIKDIVNETNGFLVTPRNSVELYTAMKRIINKKNMIIMSENSKKMSKKFDSEIVIEHYKQIYNKK